MSKGLKALGEIWGYREVATYGGYVEQPIKKVYKEELATINKELKEGEKYKKTLEIIKKDPQRALLISNYKDYNEYINDKNPYWVEKELMEKDEFDLLKEVMK